MMSNNDHMLDKIILKACIDSPNDMIILAIDKQFNYLAFNTYHEKIMKSAYDIEVKIGMNILKCITNEDDISKARINYSRAFSGASHITTEEFGKLHRSYYETRYNPIYDEQNEIVGATAFASDVTERYNTIKLLKSSEEKFRKAFITSPDSININRLSDGLYVSINEGFSKITGYTEEEAIGRSSFELDIWSIPSDRQKLVEGLRSKGKVEDLETVFKMKNGSFRNGIMSATLIDIEGVTHILSITRDITESKKTEVELKESETRFRELIELAPDGILLGSKEGIITGANSKILKLTGRRLEELLGYNIIILFLPQELISIPLRYDLLRKGEIVTNERSIVRSDGVLIPIEMRTRMMPDGSYQSNIHDISERKKIEKSLMDSERFLRESQTVAKLGTFVWELSDGIWKSSKILDEIFGIDEQYQRTLDGWGNLVHPEWHDTMLDYVSNNVLGNLQKFDKEYQIIRQSDKQVRWVHGLAELELDINRNPLRLVGTISDITSRKTAEEKLKEQSKALKKELDNRKKAEKILQKSHEELEISRRASLNLLEDIKLEVEQRKKAEEEVRIVNAALEKRVVERTAQLESANKELEAFAYSVSHDLRAPLRAIDGFSKFLIEDYSLNLDQEGTRLLGLIRENTRKMDQLILDILALSRVSRNTLKKNKVDMVKMAMSMLNEVASSEIQGRIKFIVGAMPEAYADSTYLKQVWINLISNAIKFSSKKTEPEIEFGGYSENGFHVYFVRDNGVGFKHDYAHKLFSVFQRLHKAEEFEGNGVGLAIVQRIIHRHDGKVWAEGHPGEGATFYFSLPIIISNS